MMREPVLDRELRHAKGRAGQGRVSQDRVDRTERAMAHRCNFDADEWKLDADRRDREFEFYAEVQ